MGVVEVSVQSSVALICISLSWFILPTTLSRPLDMKYGFEGVPSFRSKSVWTDGLSFKNLDTLSRFTTLQSIMNAKLSKQKF